jgi:single-strand DNA-binding protein
MNETTLTVVGTVCSEVRYGQSTDGNPIARFQIRNTPRRYDKRTNTWTDGDPNYFSAVCWRTLADHVASSMGVGDPVVATGRLRISRWRRGEENVVTAELDVHAIGHDLRWGTTVYRRSTPPGGTRIPGPGRRREEEATAAAAAAAAAEGGGELEAAGVGAGAGGGAGGKVAGAVGGGTVVAAASRTTSPEPTASETALATREVTDLPAAA